MDRRGRRKGRNVVMVEASKAVFRPRVADVPVCRGGARGVADLQSLRLDRLLRVILERRDDIGALL